MRRHDLTKKDLLTYLPSYLHPYIREHHSRVCLSMTFSFLMYMGSGALLHILPFRHFMSVMRRHDLMTIFDDNFWWQFLMTIFYYNFWWQFLMTFLMTFFDDIFWWQFLMTIFDNFWQFLTILDNFWTILTILTIETIGKTVLETWHLRHWLQFWQLRTWIQTIILTWQLIVTLDSIRNSCDVSVGGRHNVPATLVQPQWGQPL